MGDLTGPILCKKSIFFDQNLIQIADNIYFCIYHLLTCLKFAYNVCVTYKGATSVLKNALFVFFLALTAGCNYHFPKIKIRTGPGKTFALKGHDVWSWHIVLVGGVGIYNPCTVCSRVFSFHFILHWNMASLVLKNCIHLWVVSSFTQSVIPFLFHFCSVFSFMFLLNISPDSRWPLGWKKAMLISKFCAFLVRVGNC